MGWHFELNWLKMMPLQDYEQIVKAANPPELRPSRSLPELALPELASATPLVDGSLQPESENGSRVSQQPLHKSHQPWREFLTAFLTIFLAELGDKTQLATLLMAAESQSPWVVFAGAATALVATSLVGVLIGRWLATHLSPKTLKTATGASLLAIAVLLLWDVVSF